MHIMTKDGWRQLTPKTEFMPFEPPVYSGPVPSLECQSYIKRLDKEHKEWVDRRKAMTG